MSFPELALLISSKVAHFPYKLFYSLLSCCLFRLLVSLSTEVLAVTSFPHLFLQGPFQTKSSYKKSQLQFVC